MRSDLLRVLTTTKALHIYISHTSKPLTLSELRLFPAGYLERAKSLQIHQGPFVRRFCRWLRSLPATFPSLRRLDIDLKSKSLRKFMPGQMQWNIASLRKQLDILAKVEKEVAEIHKQICTHTPTLAGVMMPLRVPYGRIKTEITQLVGPVHAGPAEMALWWRRAWELKLAEAHRKPDGECSVLVSCSLFLTDLWASLTSSQVATVKEEDHGHVAVFIECTEEVMRVELWRQCGYTVDCISVE